MLGCITAGNGTTGSKCGSCTDSFTPLSLPSSSDSSSLSLVLLCNLTEPKTLLPVPGKVLLGSTENQQRLLIMIVSVNYYLLPFLTCNELFSLISCS